MTAAERATAAPPLQPAARLQGLRPYQPPDRSGPARLWLDLNEGAPDPDVLDAARARIDADALCRYPDAGPLEAEIAAAWDMAPEGVVVTNGGDEAIDRVCRAVLGPGDVALLHTPTFEMIDRSVRLAGAEVRRSPWEDGAFPVDAFQDAIDKRTRLIALVTPNNPTGGAIRTDVLLDLARSAESVGAVALIDLAYVEFMDEDATAALLERPNVVVIRTFSKALGLAGLRVGCALTTPTIATWLRTVGGPFPVSALSLAVASEAWRRRDQRASFIDRVRRERTTLMDLLARAGVDPAPSAANFVTARIAPPADPRVIAAALAERGVAVRVWGAGAPLADRLRITLPGDDDAFARLTTALDACLPEPEAHP